MPEKKVTTGLDLTDIITKAVSIQTGSDIYSNHAQIVMSSNELLIDFYQISPSIGKQSNAEAKHIQRVILPHSLVKGFVSAIANTIADFEEKMNINLVDNRGYKEDDKLSIWS